MTSAEELVPEGAEWWALPPTWLVRFDAAVESAGFEGLVLAAPRRVAAAAVSTFPVYVCQRAPYADLPRASFGANGCVVAVDLLGHHVYAGPIAIHENVVVPTVPEALLRPPRGGEPRPSLGTSTQSVRVELREQLDLPWAPTRLLLTALVCDRVSNRVESVIDVGTFHDPAIDVFLADKRDAADTPSPSPAPAIEAGALPSYVRVVGLSPPIPRDLGIALATRGSVVAGSFRLPLVEREIVKQRSSLVDPILFPSVRSTARPTAVVEIALVLTSAAGPVPTLLRLAVPAYGPLDTTDDDTASVASGTFTLDLTMFEEVDTSDPDLHVYAFADRSMAGPSPIRATR